MCGKGCYIISRSSHTAVVNAFTKDVGTIEVPIVDALLVYEDEFTGKIYYLIARNVLYVESMEYCLLPPFVLREAGLTVNERPKIHTDPELVCSADHSIIDPNSDLHIQMELCETFSTFQTRAPNISDTNRDDITVVLITPESASWDPHSSHYGENERAMIHSSYEHTSIEPSEKELFDDVYTTEELDHLNRKIQAASVSQEHQEADRILRAELEDPSFNGPSNIYTDIQASAVSACAEDAPTINGPIDLPNNIGFSPDMAEEYDIHVNAVAFTKAVDDYATECKFKSSIGGTSCYNSADVFEDSPFEPNDDGLDLGLNLYPSNVAAVASRSKGFTPDHLSKVWRIDKDAADRTIDCTTQLKKHDDTGNLTRNFSTNDRMLRYKRINSHFFTDTFQAKQGFKSKRGYKYCQLFVSDKGFIFVVFMKKRSEFQLALKAFAKEIGVPLSLVMDPSGEQTSNEVQRFAQECSLKLKILEESTQFANLAERYIGILKSAVRDEMHHTDCPIVLWDYCVEFKVSVHNVTAKGSLHLDNVNPHMVTTGEEKDISNLGRYGFYEMIYYWDQKHGFPEQKKRIGRALGPTKFQGNEMAQYILQENGVVVPRRTTRPIPPEHLRTATLQHKIKAFDDCIREKLGDSMNKSYIKARNSRWTVYEDDDEVPRTIPENDVSLDNFNVSLTDALINAEVLLHQGEDSAPLVKARVLKHLTDENGNIIGHPSERIELNTVMYEVEFPDGQRAPYAANQIAAEIYSQVDPDGHRDAIIEDIIDHCRDSKYAVKKEHEFFSHRGRKCRRKTTAGWKLLVRCKDKSEIWIPLKDLKESTPVKVALYAQSKGLSEEPAFKWWTPYVLRKADRIICKVKARMKVVTHKYGIEIPTSVDHAKELDRKNGNTLWQDALKKEMTNVSIAFDFQDHGVKPPPGWTKTSGHLVWDLKMDYTRKARWVKDGHRCPTPKTSNYAGVVSRESVRIAFTYAALNGLDVIAADVKNAYLQSPSSERHYIICGDEFGEEHNGKVALITRALYGGVFAGRDYWRHMRKFMEFCGFTSCKADSDVWMRKATTDEGFEYWEYLLLYVDDILLVSHRGEDVLRNEIGKHFELKEESIGPPDIYLGGKVRKRRIMTSDGPMDAWTFSSSQYVQAAVDNVEKYLREKKDANLNMKFPKPKDAPVSNGYRPELDESEELDEVDAAYYQSLIGVLRWIVELGRVDINCEVSMMSSCLVLPRFGHLQQVFNIFAYLKKHHNTEMIFDPSDPNIDMDMFPREDWSHSVYVGDDAELSEPVPDNAPEQRGHGFTMRLFCDSDHAGDSVTRRSRTGYLVYLQNAMIQWYSKKQTSVETSSFGSEFMALKVATEYVRGLRYKLRMMGIPINECCYVYGDNQSVLVNSSQPDSALKKKSNSIAFHHVREGTARDEWRCAYINTDDNHSDMQTKPLPFGEKRVKFCKMQLDHIYGEKGHKANNL